MDVPAGTLILVFWASVAVTSVVVMFSMIQIVPEYQRVVIFRLGKVFGVSGPGMVMVLPVIDMAIRVDIRERQLKLPNKTGLTKDRDSAWVDLLVSYRITDPAVSVVKMRDVGSALTGMVARCVQERMPKFTSLGLKDDPERFADYLKDDLNETCRQWGVETTSVRVEDISLNKGENSR